MPTNRRHRTDEEVAYVLSLAIDAKIDSRSPAMTAAELAEAVGEDEARVLAYLEKRTANGTATRKL